ncbi:hypothetical protein [Cesiribacter sp. SM1]|uniref:hypothetical protein n=1 Tax=Cesiribacter sp. SM1 TaxID=2861196 RepID=UPI001CD60F7C|nr:hypothetical protein [Cesiribacter sp. SM1]
MSVPKPKLILDYEMYFGEKPPENRISIINEISKSHILCEFAGLNYRLKPKDSLSTDISLKSQIEELKYFSQRQDIYLRYIKLFHRHTKDENDFPALFTRQACLYAIEEIVGSDEIKEIEGFQIEGRYDLWEAIIIYILAVNYAVTQIKKEEDGDRASIETLNPKLLPLNEQLVEVDPFFTIYRGHNLIEFLLNRPGISDEVIKYFQATYGIEPQHFIFHILNMCTGNNNEDADIDFNYQVSEEVEWIFEILSNRVPNSQLHKLISIRKSPFIRFDVRRYVLADITFLVEKAYYQFLNDFWFDWIKSITNEAGKPKYSIKDYRSEFGYFFESYLSKIIVACFSNYSHSKLLLFDELKVPTSNGDKEIADIYLRYGKRILLGQVKSGSIYDNEKYGGDIESLYKRDRTKFFENFGVNQVVNSIVLMNNHIHKVDNKYPKGKTIEVYPCIIVNDKALQTPLMAQIFNSRFNELLEGFEIKKMHVYPLTLIHISDIEKLENTLTEKPSEIWSFMRSNFHNKKFIPPFYFTLDKKLKGTKRYPKRIFDLFHHLIGKYNPAGLDS